MTHLNFKVYQESRGSSSTKILIASFLTLSDAQKFCDDNSAYVEDFITFTIDYEPEHVIKPVNWAG